MRKYFRHISVFALGIIASLALAMPASAKPPHAKGKNKGSFFEAPISQSYTPEERRQRPQWAQQRISYSQAKSIALSRYPGAQYIDTRLNGDTYTVILVLPNTKKVKVKIDAVTGRIR